MGCSSRDEGGGRRMERLLGPSPGAGLLACMEQQGREGVGRVGHVQG